LASLNHFTLPLAIAGLLLEVVPLSSPRGKPETACGAYIGAK
jgi:hypothetical protein